MTPAVAPRVGPVFGTDARVLIALSSLLSLVAVGLVGLRVVDARRRRRGWRWDLALAVAATVVGFVLQCVPGLLTCLNGVGTLQTELSPEQVVQTLFWGWVGVIMAIWSLALGKLSILAMYIYVTGKAARKERIFLWIMAFVAGLVCVLQMIFILTSCRPLQKLWNDALSGSCADKMLSQRLGYFLGSYSASTNVILAIYPIRIVLRLKCSRGTKIGICGVMAGGLLPAGAAIGRTVSTDVFDGNFNETGRYVILFLWGLTEQWLIIILGSLPPLRSYFARWMQIEDPGNPSAPMLTNDGEIYAIGAGSNGKEKLGQLTVVSCQAVDEEKLEDGHALGGVVVTVETNANAQKV